MTRADTIRWIWFVACAGVLLFQVLLPAFRHYVLPGLIAWAGA